MNKIEEGCLIGSRVQIVSDSPTGEEITIGKCGNVLKEDLHFGWYYIKLENLPRSLELHYSTNISKDVRIFLREEFVIIEERNWDV
jgi:hypothetical protein